MSALYFEIQADDPASLVHFYSEVFGWKFAREQQLPIEYWRTEHSGMRGAILKRPVPAPAVSGATNAFVCSFEVEDIDATASNIERLGGIVSLPKFAVPGKCWHAYFVDPAHNTFGAFEVDERAA